MKRAIVPFLAVFLVGCSGQPPEQTITVDAFLEDEKLRAEHIMRCRENPGELAQTPNCVNAEDAEGKSRLSRMNEALGG